MVGTRQEHGVALLTDTAQDVADPVEHQHNKANGENRKTLQEYLEALMVRKGVRPQTISKE